MADIVMRLLILLGCLIGCLYGIFTVRRHCCPPFFKVALCGMFAFFLSRLFYFVLTISGGNDSAFSIGVFGQSAAYLFFMVANRAYVPSDSGKAEPPVFCPSALALSVLPCVMMALCALIVGSLGAFISEILYIGSMGPSAYYSFKSILSPRRSLFQKQLAPFNICLCLLVYVNAVSELTIAIHVESVLAVSKYLLTAVSVPALLAMLPLLQRGLRQWEP